MVAPIQQTEIAVSVRGRFLLICASLSRHDKKRLLSTSSENTNLKCCVGHDCSVEKDKLISSREVYTNF